MIARLLTRLLPIRTIGPLTTMYTADDYAFRELAAALRATHLAAVEASAAFERAFAGMVRDMREGNP